MRSDFMQYSCRPELMKSRVLELNASDERGIQVVREKIKNFAMSTVRQVPGVPGYKLVILDEADSLTSDAQAALRRTMETYSKITRFCIICNYVSRIIDPVASRCSKYRFKPLDEESMLSRLKYVCESENTKADEQCLRTVLLLSQGDMRKAITLLQSASQLFGGVITSDNVVSVSGEVPADVIETFYNSIVSNTASVDSVRRASSSLLLSGYSLTTIYDKMLDLLIKDNNISDNVKALVSEKIATSEKKLVDGASEELQLYDVAASLLRMNRNILVPSDLRKSYV